MTISAVFDQFYNTATRNGDNGTAAAIKALREQVEPMNHDELARAKSLISKCRFDAGVEIGTIRAECDRLAEACRKEFEDVQKLSEENQRLTRELADAKNLVCGAVEDTHQMWLICARIKDDMDSLRSQLEQKHRAHEAYLTLLCGRLNNDCGRDPIADACIAYVATEDLIPDRFDADDYCLPGAVAKIITQWIESEKLAEQKDREAAVLRQDNEAHVERCYKAEREAAAMREALRRVVSFGSEMDKLRTQSPNCYKGSIGEVADCAKAALASDAGKGFVQRELFEKVANALNGAVGTANAYCGHRERQPGNSLDEWNEINAAAQAELAK